MCDIMGSYVDLHIGVVLVQGPHSAVICAGGVQCDDSNFGMRCSHGVQDGRAAGIPKVDWQICVLPHLHTGLRGLPTSIHSFSYTQMHCRTRSTWGHR